MNVGDLQVAVDGGAGAFRLNIVRVFVFQLLISCMVFFTGWQAEGIRGSTTFLNKKYRHHLMILI